MWPNVEQLWRDSHAPGATGHELDTKTEAAVSFRTVVASMTWVSSRTKFSILEGVLQLNHVTDVTIVPNETAASDAGIISLRFYGVIDDRKLHS